MPERSASCASSGAKGAARSRRTVYGSITSTPVTGVSSPRRFDPCIVLWRSMLNLTAAASSFSPSWNVTPWRIFIVRDFWSFDHSQEVASCGTIFRSLSMSTSLSHRLAKTMRPTKVRASVGSSTSGSSASPMRRVCAPASGAARTAAAMAAAMGFSMARFLRWRRCESSQTGASGESRLQFLEACVGASFSRNRHANSVGADFLPEMATRHRGHPRSRGPALPRRNAPRA